VWHKSSTTRLVDNACDTDDKGNDNVKADNNKGNDRADDDDKGNDKADDGDDDDDKGSDNIEADDNKGNDKADDDCDDKGNDDNTRSVNYHARSRASMFGHMPDHVAKTCLQQQRHVQSWFLPLW
jgi:hypothetical protein